MEIEQVFDPRAMLAEIIEEQYPAVAEALLDGALEGIRFFLVSSTLEALAVDGHPATEVTAAEHRLVELARVVSDDELLAAAEVVAGALSASGREDLEEQWRLAAEMTEVAAAGGEPLLDRVAPSAPTTAPVGPAGHVGPAGQASPAASVASAARVVPADRMLADRMLADRMLADRMLADRVPPDRAPAGRVTGAVSSGLDALDPAAWASAALWSALVAADVVGPDRHVEVSPRGATAMEAVGSGRDGSLRHTRTRQQARPDVEAAPGLHGRSDSGGASGPRTTPTGEAGHRSRRLATGRGPPPAIGPGPTRAAARSPPPVRALMLAPASVPRTPHSGPGSPSSSSVRTRGGSARNARVSATGIASS